MNYFTGCGVYHGMSPWSRFKHFKPSAATSCRRLAGHSFNLVLLVLLGCWLPTTAPAAESSALIVIGLSPSADDASEFLSLAAKAKSALVERGFAESRVEILHEKVTRELILQKLRAVTLSTNDEFWLVLLGFNGRAADGSPAFQVSGPRLTAPVLRAALDGIPARQFIYLGLGNGGNFIPELKRDHRTILSGTQAEGEPDVPRFTQAWLTEFAKTPHADLAEVAVRAAKQIDEDYTVKKMAQTEHACLFDPASGQVLAPPFEIKPPDTNAPAAK